MNFISIIMGSKSDFSVMQECVNVLKSFGVKHELIVSSAHRSPNRTKDYIKQAEDKGACVFIAAAGMAAHLAGAVAANTTKPVIGVPLSASELQGLDSLLSTVQMPSGMPVATVAIGKAGAQNSAYLAMQILSLTDDSLSKKLKDDRAKKAQKVQSDSESIEIRL